MTTSTLEPNHHAGYPGFAGLSGVTAALSMAMGHRSDAVLAARLTAAGPGDHVVDIGCGPGNAARRARRLGAQVTAVDPAAVMRRMARVLTVRTRGLKFVAGTAEHVPVENDGATIVWSLATVHHWADLEAGLREAKRILRSGGRFLAIERQTVAGAEGHASHGWTEAQASAFAERLREHGFADVRVEGHEGRRSVWSVLATLP